MALVQLKLFNRCKVLVDLRKNLHILHKILISLHYYYYCTLVILSKLFLFFV